MSAYLLPKHVFLCMHGSDVIFLDLKADRYLAMDAAKVIRVIDLPNVSSGTERTSTGRELPIANRIAEQKSAQALLDRGLLTEDRAAGKKIELATTESPDTDLIGIAPPIRSRVGLLDLFRFITATASSWIALRALPLETVVSKAASRRRQRSIGAAELDMDRASSCVALFERMRPYVFSARDACLFESFVLANFLAKYGLYPQWVFGVKTDPFAAHCWLQHQNTVFNDNAEHASEFTPIMVI